MYSNGGRVVSGSVSLLFFLVIAWFTIEFVTGDILPAIRRSGARVRPLERGSSILILLTVYPSLAIAFVLAMGDIGLLSEWVFCPGLLLMFAGIAIRQWAVLTLGRYFSGIVGVQEGQKVVDDGPYRYVRHPAYTGMFVAFLGLGLALQSWCATLVLIVVLTIALWYRIRVEEKALAIVLGEEYLRYAKRTRMLIPFIF